MRVRREVLLASAPAQELSWKALLAFLGTTCLLQ